MVLSSTATIGYLCRINVWGAHIRTDITGTTLWLSIRTPNPMLAGMDAPYNLGEIHENRGSIGERFVFYGSSINGAAHH